MLHLPDQRDFTDLPFIRMITMAYAFLSILIIPAAFLITMLLLPAQRRAFKAATNHYEKTYWRLKIVGLVLMIYGAVVFGLCLIDGVRDNLWRLLAWWPSMSRVWYGNAPYANVILDMATFLVLGFGAIFVSNYFGRADENGVWHKPEWLALKHYINQVIIDNDMILDRDPSLQVNFATLTESVQRKKMHEWEQELAANEQRLNDVLHSYRASLSHQ